MEGIYTQVKQLLNQPEEYIRPSKKLEEAWMKQTQAVYNFLKEEEDQHGLPVIPGALPHLETDGLDVEQVWQLVELQNKALLAAPEDLDGLDHTNLCFMVAKLSSLAKHNKLSRANELLTEDEGIGGSPQESDDMEADDVEEDKEEIDDVEEMLDEDMSGDDDDEDDELFEKPEDLKDTGLNDVFGDDSDDEEDNFDEFIAKEGVESDSDEDEGDKRKGQGSKADELKSEAKQEKKKEGKKFGKTEIDTKFFNLRESEWVADQDAIGENYSGDDEDIDLMADMSDGSEEEDGIMYDAFFDQGPEGTDGTRSSGKKLSEMLEDDEDEDEEGDEDEDFKEEEEKEEEDERTAKDLLRDDSDDEEADGTQLLGGPKKESKSTFEKEREKELELMEQLEEENLNEKPWYLKGEVGNADRPQNSALEEHLEYDIAVRQKPIITEDTTSQVEKIIMGRIRIKAWDDVERKVKPSVDPFEFKKKLVLEQDKSKKSLAEIYEEEYLKKQKEEKEAGEEELEEHKEIKERMDKLFMKLDALSNYHYTPRQPGADIKIVSNLPAITVEETTPATASDATLLAPQEILEPTRGEKLGDTERTATDRKRDRRIKKKHQKNKAKMQEKKLQEKVQRAGAKGGTGKLDRGSTMKVIEKAVKSGQVKLLEGTQDKAVKSSQSFFKQLQDTQSKKQKNENTKKRKKDQLSASKLLM